MAPGISHADVAVSVASFADTLNGGGTSETFTGGSNGTLYTVSQGNSQLPVTTSDGVSGTHAGFFSLSDLTVLGASGPNTDGSRSEKLSSGTFSLDAGGNNLLSGTFTDAFLTGRVGVPTMTLESDAVNVTYVGGIFLSEDHLAAGDKGSYSFSFSASQSNNDSTVGPQFNSSEYIEPFTSGGTAGTFDAVVPGGSGLVPEPGQYASFGVGILGLLGLIVGRRRRGQVNSRSIA
jgi:hypothetical protein